MNGDETRAELVTLDLEDGPVPLLVLHEGQEPWPTVRLTAWRAASDGALIISADTDDMSEEVRVYLNDRAVFEGRADKTMFEISGEEDE